jgi:hypothetical protein
MTTPASATGLAAIDHVVVLMRENRWFDHLLGFQYAGGGNVSPTGAWDARMAHETSVHRHDVGCLLNCEYRLGTDPGRVANRMVAWPEVTPGPAVVIRPACRSRPAYRSQPGAQAACTRVAHSRTPISPIRMPQ